MESIAHCTARLQRCPYSKGAQEGAPQAILVADRFHLLMNLGDATKRMFQSMGKELRELFTLYNKADKSAEPVSTTEDIRLKDEDVESIATPTINTNIELQLRFDKVKELFSQGYTIRKYIGMDFLPKKRGADLLILNHSSCSCCMKAIEENCIQNFM